ncbi:MAG: hypothetical protein WCA27_23330 [Candidatus Sulfotelmatobacter sp.]
MTQDFAFNQSDILSWHLDPAAKNFVKAQPGAIFDVQLRGGICFAMTLNWCEKMLSGQPFDITGDQYRVASSMRAYQMMWEDKIKGLTAADYSRFFKIAEPVSYNFFSQSLARQGLTSKRLKFHSVDSAKASIAAVSRTAMLGLFGTENGCNWGHATGLAAGWKFFDPNRGQWSATSAKSLADDVAVYLNYFYKPATVRTVVIYTAS